jgi:hypothetical protein
MTGSPSTPAAKKAPGSYYQHLNKRDHRGNIWWSVNISLEQQAEWESYRSGWASVSDEDIKKAKESLLDAFADESWHDVRNMNAEDVKGMACRDFIYLFDTSQAKHFFFPTSGEEKCAMLYECDSGGTQTADMAFAPHCTWVSVRDREWERPAFAVEIGDRHAATVLAHPRFHKQR